MSLRNITRVDPAVVTAAMPRFHQMNTHKPKKNQTCMHEQTKETTMLVNRMRT